MVILVFEYTVYVEWANFCKENFVALTTKYVDQWVDQIKQSWAITDLILLGLCNPNTYKN